MHAWPQITSTATSTTKTATTTVTSVTTTSTTYWNGTVLFSGYLDLTPILAGRRLQMGRSELSAVPSPLFELPGSLDLPSVLAGVFLGLLLGLVPSPEALPFTGSLNARIALLEEFEVVPPPAYSEVQVFHRLGDLRASVFSRGNPGWLHRSSFFDWGRLPLKPPDLLTRRSRKKESPCPEGAEFSVAAIPVTVIEERCLVAVPHSTWNKATARRKLPRQGLTRAVNLEVAAQGDPPSSSHAALRVKVWLGFLDKDLEDSWSAGGGGEAQYPFRVAGSQTVAAVPFFPGLSQAAQEQFGYETGLSGAAPEGEEEADGLEDRVGAIEKALGAVQKGLDRLLQLRSAAPKASDAAAATPKPSAVQAPLAAPVPPGLDPATVAEARRAGIPEAQLRLLSELASKPNKMADGRGARVGARKSGPLSESEEDAPAGGGTDLLLENTSALPPVEKAVVEMSAVLRKLATREEKGRLDLEDLLDRADGVSFGSGDGSGSLGTSRSKTAAYMRLCRMLKEEPERIVESITRLVEEDFTGLRAGPGASQQTATMRGWLEHRSHIPGLAGPVRWAWAVGGIADCLAANRHAEAHARSLLLLAAADQAAVDSGSWLLGAEFLLESAAPIQAFSRHRGPELHEQQHTRILDQRWIHVAMSRVRERESFVEVRKKLGGGASGRPAAPAGSGSGDTPEKDEKAGKGARKGQKGDQKGALFVAQTLCFFGASQQLLFASRTALMHQGPLGRVWPMPVPFASLHRPGANRKQKCAARKLGLNALVLALSWLSLGCPSTAPPFLGLGAELSREQWAVVRRLSANVSAWNASDPVDWAAMGRSAARVESTEDSLRALSSQPGLASEFSGAESAGALASSALDIDPSRIAFTGSPTFDPRPFLGPGNRLRYEKPLSWAASASPLKPVPRVRVHCQAHRVREFLELLDSGGRLELLPLREVDFSRACGVFAVCKDASRDRLVLDARPANAYEDPSNPWVRSLASVEQLRFAYLEDDEDVLVHSEDIRDFYHVFQVGGERCRRNALRLRLKPQSCRGLGAFRSELEHEEWLVPALRTVAMGDTAAVGLAQCAHLGVILSTESVDLGSFVTLEGRPPRCGPICGLMIDDFVVLDRVRRQCPVPQGPRIISAVRTAYSKVGLPRHEKKAVEGEPLAEFWGCVLDGKTGIVRPNYKRAVPLGFLVLRLVVIGRVTSELLDSLVGGLVSCFQYRRRCLSLLQQVYSDPRPRDRSAHFKLSKGMIGELLASVALLPQCDIDLRAKAVPFVLATDASNEAEAGAICPVPLTADPGNELPGEGDCYSSHPLWEELATSQPFFDFGRIVYVRVPRHINIGEMRAALRAEERLSRKHQDVRFTLLQDSQVSLAAMSKGRSSSGALNRELRRSLGTYLGAGLRPGYAYLQSKLNPPDDRTRNTPLRQPSREASQWFREFLDGDLEALDRFLSSVHLADRQVQGLPDPAEIKLPPATVGVDFTEPPAQPVNCSGLTPWTWCCDRASDLEAVLQSSKRREVLERIVSSGCLQGMYLRPAAGTFSTAVRPPLRSREFPLGVPECSLDQRARLERGNDELAWVQTLCKLANAAGIFVIVDHPANSLLWKHPGWHECQRASGWADSVVDLCRFGAPFRKATKLRVRSLFGSQSLRCNCSRPHLQLRGRNAETGSSWSWNGAERPKLFWSFLAGHVADRLRAQGDRGRLDVAGCAHVGSLRVGEAGNPGPRVRRSRPQLSLAGVSLVEPATAALRNKYWEAFGLWVDSAAGEGAFELVVLAPQLMIKLLVAFAQHLYDAGTPLHYYRQLVAHAQREVPSCRFWAREAWDYVTRWETLEPLQHRPPMPEPVLHAMCSLAAVWGWRRWAAITLVAFYAICRPGEPLRAVRKDLVTSEDLLEAGREVFLRIPEPKTRRRGAAVQHAQVKGPEFVMQFIGDVFQGLLPNEPLYNGSPGMYRRRWDALLRSLWIEPKHKLTPGSLRGGGAVRAYRIGEPLNEVQWRMRLRHQVTLGYYLQEVAALSILPALSDPARTRVRSSAALLPFVLARGCLAHALAELLDVSEADVEINLTLGISNATQEEVVRPFYNAYRPFYTSEEAAEFANNLSAYLDSKPHAEVVSVFNSKLDLVDAAYRVGELQQMLVSFDQGSAFVVEVRIVPPEPVVEPEEEDNNVQWLIGALIAVVVCACLLCFLYWIWNKDREETEKRYAEPSPAAPAVEQPKDRRLKILHRASDGFGSRRKIDA
ncbi:unnamed protein product [Symbiodinium sp. CCMP2592]|nr:unnamed protein product [Symbiodinium sp. CCMP2592]